MRSTEVNGQSYKYYLLDFAKQREVGPGKVSNDEETSGIRLPEGVTFGEETAALYCQKKWLLVLHNHYGVGASRIASYFNLLGESKSSLDYLVVAKLDTKVQARLESLKGLKTIQISAARSALEQSGKDHLTAVGEAVKESGTQWLHFELRANLPHGRGSIFNDSVKRLIEKLSGKDSSEVSRLKVTGVDPVDEKDAVLDLIHHRMKVTYDRRELEIVDGKYSTDSRWRLLERSLNRWLKEL
jgi:hypothetical protein